MSAVRAGRVLKKRGRRPKKSVLRMMAIMTDGNKEELPKEFVEGGRTGRRNAMPDIMHSDANVTTADLPERLQQLATSVSESSWKYCCSEERLQQFLQSGCSKRRFANPCCLLLPDGIDDPNNPQPGPSSGSTPTGEENKDEQKKGS